MLVGTGVFSLLPFPWLISSCLTSTPTCGLSCSLYRWAFRLCRGIPTPLGLRLEKACCLMCVPGCGPHPYCLGHHTQWTCGHHTHARAHTHKQRHSLTVSRGVHLPAKMLCLKPRYPDGWSPSHAHRHSKNSLICWCAHSSSPIEVTGKRLGCTAIALNIASKQQHATSNKQHVSFPFWHLLRPITSSFTLLQPYFALTSSQIQSLSP